MNLTQLIHEVNKDIDDNLPDSDIIGWLNRCLDDLTDIAKYQKESIIPLVPGVNKYNLPEDLHEIELLMTDKELEQIPLREKHSEGFKLWGNTLTIQPEPESEIDLSIYYYAKLPHLEKPDDTPVIPSEFHDLLVLYAAAKAKYQDEEESMQQNVLQEYFTRKRQFEGEMLRKQEPSYVRLVD